MNAQIESNEPVISCEYTAIPSDSRCKYWCKIVRDGQVLPLPHVVRGANDIPGEYLRKGDDIEIFPGDYILEGEQVHHVKQRGWKYNLGRLALPVAATETIDTEGNTHPGEPAKPARIVWLEYGKPVKDALRAAGYKTLLGGSGDVAGMVRSIHARREGVWPVK